MEDVRISVYIFKDRETETLPFLLFYFTKQNVLPWGKEISCEVDGIYDIFKFKTKSKLKPSLYY